MNKFFLSGSIARQLGVRGEEPSKLSSSLMLAAMMRAAQIENRPGVDVMTHAIHSAMESACLIVGSDPKNGENWVGSGFLIEGGLVLTVAHVLPQGDSTVRVSFDGEHFVEAIAVTRNDDYDVGSLKLVDEIDAKPAKLAAKDKELLPGEQIAVIGSPEGWENVVTVGRISAVGRTPKIMPDSSWQELIFIDADILEGSSGSMVIDAEGEVVGMVMGLIGQHVEDFGNGQRAVIPTPRIFEALVPEGGGVPQGSKIATREKKNLLGRTEAWS